MLSLDRGLYLPHDGAQGRILAQVAVSFLAHGSLSGPWIQLKPAGRRS
jgi:hypothetical protein